MINLNNLFIFLLGQIAVRDFSENCIWTIAYTQNAGFVCMYLN